MSKNPNGRNNLEIKLIITNCSDEYRYAIYNMLNQLHQQNESIFNYKTILQNPPYDKK